MSEQLISWYLNSIDFERAPKSLAELESRFEHTVVDQASLRHAAKWEPILRGKDTRPPAEWTNLGTLASTRRGIATGSNELFLISAETAEKFQISTAHLLPCVGRANDVPSLIFSDTD